MVAKRRESLTTQVVRTLTERIESGTYERGAKLPTEQEMIEEFGVSRTVVREAIANLKSSGYVSTHQGIGAFVMREPPTPSFRIATDNMQLIEEVVRGLELRISIEAEAAALAAMRRTEADLGRIAASCDAMDTTDETDEARVEADLAFHRSIARATQNDNFLNIFNYLGKVLIPRTRLATHRYGASSMAEYLARINAEHRQILAAIEAGDPDGARAAMRMHLSGSRDRLLRSAEGGSG